MQVSPFPRSVRPVSDPLALYFRVGRNDHTALNNLLATGRPSFFGVVIDASRVGRHRELLAMAEQTKLDCILDPCTQASATPGGYTKDYGQLPWGTQRQHVLTDFQGTNQKRVVSAIADFVGEHGFSQVMTPSHLIRDVRDPWFESDIEACHRLREQLDRSGKKKIGLIYSLCLPYASFRDEDIREQLVSRLDGLPAQSIWLRVDGCGSDSSPAAVKNYLEAAADFHRLGIPIISDQVGGLVGLTLLAFSAIGGIANGVTLAERFNAQRWRHTPKPQSHMMHPRVYFPTLDLYLKPKEAQSLLDGFSRLKSHFACNDSECCPRGALDMVQNPARHFLIQRSKQVSALAQIPEQLRPKEFVERFVRPTTDEVLRVASMDKLGDQLQKRLMAHRKRLDAMRVTLGRLVDSRSTVTHSEIPATRAVRDARF